MKLPDILHRCPTTGDGVHQWIFKAACALRDRDIDEDEAQEILFEASKDCGREVELREIENAVENAYGDAPSERGPRWQDADLLVIERIGRAGKGVAGLQRQSGTIPDNATEILSILFPGNPLICIAKDQKSARVRRLDDWPTGWLKNRQFIVPNPMSKPKGFTKGAKPKESVRCLDNTGPRRFLVIECDFVDPQFVDMMEGHGVSRRDLCASVILELASIAPDEFPLAMVVDSAGKSLHGWFYCADTDDDLIEDFFKLAVKYGADPATWVKCQLVRLPWGARDGVRGGDVQEVIFFNPQFNNG